MLQVTLTSMDTIIFSVDTKADIRTSRVMEILLYVTRQDTSTQQETTTRLLVQALDRQLPDCQIPLPLVTMLQTHKATPCCLAIPISRNGASAEMLQQELYR